MKRKDFDDDGRVIANMNVEGMPWYDPKRDQPSGQGEQLTRRQTARVILNAWGASMLVVAVFSAAIVLFVWLLTHVWGA